VRADGVASGVPLQEHLGGIHAVSSPLECRLDGGGFEPCEAKVKLRGLEPGRHVFRARSFAFGGYDPSPATKRFPIPK